MKDVLFFNLSHDVQSSSLHHTLIECARGVLKTINSLSDLCWDKLPGSLQTAMFTTLLQPGVSD